MKYYKQVGIAGCLLIIVACFLPFAYYPDLHVSFTGFYSEENIYGKPGKLFIFFAVCAMPLILLNKVWAKRVLVFIVALHIGYLLKTYTLFTSCYNTYCPEVKYGLYLLIAGTVLLALAALLPGLKLKTTEQPADGPKASQT